MEALVRCGAGDSRILNAVQCKPIRPRVRIAVWVLWLLALVLVTPVSATSYVYDANGRLIAVTNDAGESARYFYDVMGNIQKVDRLAADELALFGFTPGRGVSGMLVRLQGNGFSTEPTANVVLLSGVAAPVTQASTRELLVLVPAGAATGPITVSVGAQTVTSSVDFVVDQNAQVPRIDGISPQVVSTGGNVTVTGGSLYPVAHQTTARIGTRSAVIRTATNLQLEFVVPPVAASGRVSVSTPYGMAVSTQDLMVLPAGVAATDIAMARRIVPDAPAVPFSIQSGAQQVAVLVDADVGEHLDAQFSDLGAANLNYALYDTSNRRLVTGTANAANPSVLLPPAPSAGTYLLLIKPAQAPASWNLAIERSRKISPGEAPVVLATTVAGQKKRIVFSATIDQRLGLGLEDMVLSSGTTMTASVMNRDSTLSTAYCYTNYGGCQANIRAAQTAAHTVVLAPYSTNQTFQAKVTLSSDLMIDLPREVPLELTVPRRGQNARLFFQAQAGESLALQVVNQSTLPAAKSVNYGVYKPDGTLLKSGSTTSHQLLNLPSLPQSGQYFVFVDADYGETLTSRVILSEGIGNGGQVDGDVGDFSTDSGGQSVYFNFDVTEVDQRLGVGISDLVLSSGSYVWAYVYRPDGVSVGSASCYQSDGGCAINVRAPVVGRYSVVVQPVTANQAMRLRAWVSSDLHADIGRETPMQLALIRRGQNARLYFDAMDGESLAIQVAGQSSEPASKSVSYQVYRPDGTLLASTSTSGSDTLRLPTLAQAGRYMLFVDPSYGAKLQARITLTAGRQSGMEIDGAPGEFAAPIAGHPAYLTFTTTMADQRLGLGLRDIVLSTGSYITVSVYGPGGDALASRTCHASDNGCDVNIRAPRLGTHSVVISPQIIDQVMRFKAVLSNDQMVDLVREQPLNLNLARAGQNARLKFKAEAGENLALQINSQSSAYDHMVYYTVYKPDGTSLTSTGTRSFDDLRMMKLPVAGEYLVFVDPNYGATVQARVLLTAGNGGAPELDGAVGNVEATIGGQATFTTFEVNEIDQRIGIGISDLKVSDGSYVSVTILRPNGTAATSVYCYQSNPGCDLNLRAPEVGVYGIFVKPQIGTQRLDYKITVSNDLRRPLLRETPLVLDIPRRGQNGRLTFNAQAGETLGLQIVGQKTGPTGGWVSYQVYKPDGSSLASRSVSSFETMNLPALPVSGEYLVFVDPSYGATSLSEVVLTAGAGSGTEIDGAQGEFTTTQPGQPIYMTFQATAGEQLGLGISDLAVSSGSYVSVYVYRPGGASATSTTCDVSYQGCALAINAVESGTYSVVTTPQSASQTVQYKATLSRDLRMTLARNESLDLVIPRRGQKARLSFTGEAGDAVALQVAGQVSYPASRSVNYRIYKPDGSSLNSIGITGYGTQELRLPVSGTYQVLVEPNYGATVNSRITLAAGSLQTLGGEPVQVETNYGGQTVHSTFQAAAGEQLGLGISDLSVSSGSYVSVYVYRPNGATIASTTCYVSYEGCALSINATDSGTYSVATIPQNANQTMRYRSTLSRDMRMALGRNEPLDLVIPRRGQKARLSFTGAAGDAVALQVAGQTTSPASRSVNYRVYKPDGGSLNSFSTTVYDSQELRLPVSGTYQVLVETNYGETVNSRITLAAGDVQPVDGVPAQVETSYGGQAVHATFQATAGQALGVGLYDLTVSSGSYVSVVAYRPDGTTAASSTCYASNHGCKLNVSATLTGTYSVAVTPQSGSQTFSYKLAISRDQLGTLQVDQPLGLVLSRRGQNARLTFVGQAGQWMSLQIAEQTTAPPNRAIYYRVYRPDGTQLASTYTAAYDAIRMPALPTSGEYTVLVDSQYGETLQTRLVLASGGSSLALDGASANVATEVGGQEVFLSFEAEQGQRLGVGLSNLQVSAGTYFTAVLYRPDSTTDSANCYPQYGGCQMRLTANANGIYRLFVRPWSATQRVQFTATASTDVAHTLVRGAPLSLSLPRHGQNGWLSFAGNAGESVALHIADQITQPTGGNVYYVVYKPDGSSLTSVNVTGSRALQLPALPTSGTYRVLVSPSYGLPVNVTLTLN